MQFARHQFAFDGERGAGQSGRPQRAFVHAPTRVGEPRAVAEIDDVTIPIDPDAFVAGGSLAELVEYRFDVLAALLLLPSIARSLRPRLYFLALLAFFVFAGELMLHGGIAERIVRLANSLVGHVRGGLGMSNVLGCTLFGGIVGSPVADVSAMGSVMIPLMKKEGYDADYAVNVTTHAALVGAIMPTSHNLILFTLATSGLASVSVLGLILAGVVPALILTLCNLLAAWWVARPGRRWASAT